MWRVVGYFHFLFLKNEKMEKMETEIRKKRVSVYAIPGLTVGGINTNIKRNYLEIEEIRQIVAIYFSISIYNLDLNSRKREIVNKRQIAHYLAKIHTAESLSNIGKEIGNKDHATVLNSSKTINNMIDTNSEMIDTKLRYVDVINDLEVMIKNRKNKR